nr:hypothetical protein [Kibdelosporangium sp. MJ126-NF4]CTQ92151.1 hypothetical protein [Kibdelosporangium sp. MJ126-NF4]
MVEDDVGGAVVDDGGIVTLVRVGGSGVGVVVGCWEGGLPPPPPPGLGGGWLV